MSAYATHDYDFYVYAGFLCVCGKNSMCLHSQHYKRCQNSAEKNCMFGTIFLTPSLETAQTESLNKLYFSHSIPFLQWHFPIMVLLVFTLCYVLLDSLKMPAAAANSHFNGYVFKYLRCFSFSSFFI